MKKRKNGFVTFESARGLMIGALIALCSVLICSLIAAAIALGADDPMGMIGICSFCALLCSGAICGVILTRLSGAGTKNAVLSSLVAVAVMAVCSLIITHRAPSPSALMNYVSFVGSAAIFSFLGRKRAKRHKPKRRY
jgi:hypothetical protein